MVLPVSLPPPGTHHQTSRLLWWPFQLGFLVLSSTFVFPIGCCFGFTWFRSLWTGIFLGFLEKDVCSSFLFSLLFLFGEGVGDRV